jgi:glutamine synthetase
MTSPSGSTVDEAKAFLDSHPDVEAFDILLTDTNGVGRGKIIRRHELLSIYEGGRHMPISILGLDITGEDVHETGLIWDSGDGDLRAWPIPGTLKPLYGTDPARGQVLLSMYHLDGQPMSSDPRHALARQIEALAARGLHPAGAFELEFFLLKNERDGDGRVQPASAVLDGRSSGKTEVYSVDHLHGMEPLFSDIYACAKAQGIPVETLISEYAPGQYELTLHYRKGVLQAADDLILLKRLVRMQARRHGVTACFMAKPIEKYAGSGMHFHVSMLDAAGKNIFSEEVAGAWNPAILNAIGGLAATMPESMLIFAPHANSWRRFVAQSYAPLAAIAKGLDEKLDPGAETTGNGYESAPKLADAPSDWRSAIEAAKASSFLRQALGEDLHRTFTAIKQAEYMRVARTVSELDYHLYLHEV